MTEIPVEDMDLPIKYEEFKEKLLDKQSKLELEGRYIKGITLHHKTARTILSLVAEKESPLVLTGINWYKEIFGIKIFLSTDIPETEYYFLVD